MLGVAAHITAASPRGPRYNAALTDSERASALNGIWLCQNCAKLIDNDPHRYTVELLTHWKVVAEQLAFDNVGRSALFAREGAPSIASTDTAITNFSNTQHVQEHPTIRELFPNDLPEDAEFHTLAEGINGIGLPFLVVGAGTEHNWKWRVLYVVRSEYGWSQQAVIELESQKRRVPQVHYIPGLPGAIFQDHVAGWGTGVFRKVCSVYRISPAVAEAVLQFPTYFHVVGWGMPFDRHLRMTTIQRPSTLVAGATLKLVFEVDYDISATHEQSESKLLQYSYSFTLEWDEGTNQFAPATSADDLSILDAVWNEDLNKFVQRCRADLLALAETGTNEQKAFVRKYVQT